MHQCVLGWRHWLVCVLAFFQNSTRDALHQRRSSNELNSGTAALASTRSASISVTGSGHVFPTKGDLKGHQPQVCLAPFPNNGVTSETATDTTAGNGNENNSKNAHIQELLSQSESWNLDIFALERLTDHRCLSNLGMKPISLFVCSWGSARRYLAFGWAPNEGARSIPAATTSLTPEPVLS